MNKIKKLKVSTAIMSICLASTFVGCGDNYTDNEYVEKANVSIQRGENNAAIINLKNALKVNPLNNQARFLLGKTYIDSGNWSSGQKELARVYEKGVELSQSSILLAKSLYHLGDLKGIEELVSIAEQLPVEAQVALKTFAAMTYIKEEDKEQGLIYLYEVLEYEHQSQYVQLSRAWKHGLDQEIDIAIEVINNLLVEYPDFAEAIEYQAYLYFNQNKMEEAASSFGKYLTLHPLAHELRLMQALSLVYAEDYEAAEKQADTLLRIIPKHPRLNEIKSQARFAAQDFELAKQFAEIAIRSDNRLVAAKIVAGISAYQLKQLESAYSYLNSVSDYLTYKHPAKKILTVIKLELGYENDVFNDLSNAAPEQLDANVLSASAIELFKIGQAEKADKLLSMAVEQNPDDAGVVYQQGMLKLYNNDSSASEFFERSLQLDPELESAMTMLIVERLRKGEIKEALSIANALEEKNKELSSIYKGIIYLHQKEFDKAEQELKAAISLNDVNPSSHAKLGVVYQQQALFEQAADSFIKALSINHKYPLAITSLLKLAPQENLQVKIKAFLQKLANENSDIQGELYLAFYHIVLNQLSDSLAILNSALSSQPESSKLLMLKGKVQANLKDYDGAIASFEQILKHNQYDGVVYLALANMYELKADLVKAIELQKKAIDLLPGNIGIALNLVELYVKNNDMITANKVLANIRLRAGDHLGVTRLSGKLAFIDKDYKKAESYLVKVFPLLMSENITLELATSYQRLNRVKDALEVINQYRETVKNYTPLDILLKHAELLEQSDIDEAMTVYQEILTKTDRHFAMLNNLAMLHLQKSETKKALDYAKEAYQKAPEVAAIQNTLGLAYLESGKINEAEQYLQQAFNSKPNVNYKVHYANALYKGGKQEECRSLLVDIREVELNKFTLSIYDHLKKKLAL